ncbi:MAG: UDP-N-acetylmuramoyl-L-alanine--D-glutamate ligase [Hyphomicrobiaceae bacterium]
MIPVTSFAGCEVAVFGLGASGRSTCRALLAGGAGVAAWDDGEVVRNSAAYEGLPIVDLANADWRRFAALVLAPGVPLTHPEPHWTVKRAREAGIEVIGDIELFFRARTRLAPASQVICITGTNGKSTTTALIAHTLAAAGADVQMGGNIGVPVLDLAPPDGTRIHVLEMSTFQIDLTPSLAPTIGVLLNLSPDHLDRHGTMEQYAAIKERLVACSRAAVIGLDDPLSAAIAARIAAQGTRVLAISSHGPRRDVLPLFFAENERLRAARGDATPTDVGSLAGIGSLRGRHNMQNALAALAAASLALPGAALTDHVAAFRSFPGLPHRMEEVGRKGRVLFINDSKATNADSAEKALTSWPRDIYWIAGGLPKEGGITPLTACFPRVAKAYLIGAAAEDFARTLDGRVPYELSGTLDKALAAAARDAAASGASEPVVLLSPACASYDQFKSYGHRGDVFRALVADLIRDGEGA